MTRKWVERASEADVEKLIDVAISRAKAGDALFFGRVEKYIFVDPTKEDAAEQASDGAGILSITLPGKGERILVGRVGETDGDGGDDDGGGDDENP